MIKKIILPAVILFLLFTGSLKAQTIISPNYSLKSHETLNIIKIEIGSEATIFYLRIENKIEKGTFCADKNIFVFYPDGMRSKLVSSTGIPVCPDTHQFKSPGESLEFVLTFPPLKKGTEWIDLIEECSENCFSFYGISLDNDLNKRIGYIRFNGDLVIIYGLIAIAGGLLTAITIGLFDSIGLNIGKFYSEYIVISGAAAAPVVAAFIYEKFPALVSKTAPLLATIFSPLVLVTLVIFLVTILAAGKDPYNDRDFLLIFNAMLLGVMGIVIFSVSETSVIRNKKFNAIVLLVLSVITIVVDLIALSAIFYRLGEYGLTPNRLAVLISNILVLINLILITKDLFRINFGRKDFRTVGITVSKFLPVYLIWIVIVVFSFPFIFGMK